MPGGFDPNNMPEGFDMENFDPYQFRNGEMPEGMEMPEGGFGGMNFSGQMPENFDPSQFQPGERPEGEFERGEKPDGMQMPEGVEMPEDFELAQMPQGGMNFQGDNGGEASTDFYMQDQVNFFSGLTNV